MRLILSIDQSTSATKGYVWDLSGELLGSASVPHRQMIDDRGWVEHDPAELFGNTLKAAKLAIERADTDAASVAAVGISNQRETVLCWDRQTGEPLYNAIVWQCGRAATQVERLEKEGVAPRVHRKTGIPLSPYFSAAKALWMIENVPQVREARDAGRLCVGTVDAWLIFKLTGGFMTEYANASRTQLLNIDTLDWDEELLEMFGLNRACMPFLCMSDSEFGLTDLGGVLPRRAPLHGVLGDSHAALLANRCLVPGAAKATYGTGASVMMNAGWKRPSGGDALAVSLAWGMSGRVAYVLEGNVNYAGSVIRWLCDDLGLLAKPGEAGEIAASVDGTHGVYLVPAFSGLGAPWFRSDVRAAFLGMDRTTTRAHLIRAAEESIAYQVTDVVGEMLRASETRMSRLNADGGATRDEFLMQFQADVLGMPLYVNRMDACSASGAALLAAVGAGLCDMDTSFVTAYRRVEPAMPQARRAALYDGWKAALAALLR